MDFLLLVDNSRKFTDDLCVCVCVSICCKYNVAVSTGVGSGHAGSCEHRLILFIKKQQVCVQMPLTPATPKLNLELPEPKHSPLPFHLARTEMGRRGVRGTEKIYISTTHYISMKKQMLVDFFPVVPGIHRFPFIFF